MNADQKAWYQIENIEEIDSPALVIFSQRVKHNIELAITMIGDASGLRPHVKTHKTKQVVSMMMQSGITKFKCATIAEAEMVASCSAVDVLLAYQPVGPKLKRLLSLMNYFPATRFSCLIDNSSTAEIISEEAVAHNTAVTVFIDLNVGMNRTGILPEDAQELYRHCRQLKGLTVAGVHAYDGHINDSDTGLRRQRADAASRQAEEVKNELMAAEMANPVVVIGGSPTYPIHAKKVGVECSPGTFAYWDKAYSDLFPDMNFVPAALVISRVISVLNDTTACLDLGHKSIAAENVLECRVFFLNAPGLKFISQSEEHLVVSFPEDHHLKTGDVLYGIPFHVCPTCALYDVAVVIQNSQAKEQWQMIARNRKLSI